jgi:hypothetical protein
MHVILGMVILAAVAVKAGRGGYSAVDHVLGFALIKGQMVGDYFMGLKGIKGPWRWVIALWLVLPGALITTAFILAG